MLITYKVSLLNLNVYYPRICIVEELLAGPSSSSFCFVSLRSPCSPLSPYGFLPSQIKYLLNPLRSQTKVYPMLLNLLWTYLLLALPFGTGLKLIHMAHTSGHSGPYNPPPPKVIPLCWLGKLLPPDLIFHQSWEQSKSSYTNLILLITLFSSRLTH
jgi:hypothetical protein